MLFWALVASFQIGLGLFIFTQGGKYFGPFLVMVGMMILVVLAVSPAKAHDDGQWEQSDPAIREWYRSLMQPDVPTASCCGEADAYWCDTIHIRSTKTFCTITDDRPDEPRHRPHVDVGTEIEIPNHKLKYDRGNPTGHSIVFLSRQHYVYCFVQNGGV